VLELSLQDQGGRAGGGGYSAGHKGVESSSAQSAQASAAQRSGYAPSSSADKSLPDPSRQGSGSSALAPAEFAPPTSSSAAPPPVQPVATRVRALYDFTPTEAGELAFRKGEVLRVLDSVYEHWWRGEVNGEVGIFPVNFVEVLPDPTPADLQREAEMEARIFAQANNIDRLLSKLRGLDPARDNLAEDEELQELYQSSLSMRPKIVRLIDRYNTKVNELRTMNEKFVRARSTFDNMMEQSLAKYNPSAHREEYVNARPEYGYSAAPQGGYQQAPPQQQQPQQLQQPQMPYQQQSPGGEGQSLQQQEEYSQSWAAWYAQQGYQQPNAAGSQSGAPLSQQPPHAPSPAPPNVNDPAYAQWYYSHQQQQQFQQPPQPQQQAQQPQQAAPQQQQQQQQQPILSSAPPLTSPSIGYDYHQQAPQLSDGNASLHDQEKRAMFERARAEAEAYHRAHQQQQQGSGSSEPLL
jgi:signal transducing adaptor molecule